MREWHHWIFQKFNLSAAISNIYAQFASVSRGGYSAYTTFQQRFKSTSCMCKYGVLKDQNILNFSAAIGNIYAHVAPVKRGLNWAYFMFNSRFRKYFLYAQMSSFIFETIIEFSSAIRNVNAQLVLMNRGLTSTYITLIWMLLWDPLTYLFHWGTRVLVCFYFRLIRYVYKIDCCKKECCNLSFCCKSYGFGWCTK